MVFDVGVEALVTGIPRGDDAWRVLVDTVSYGDDATQDVPVGELPALDDSSQWLRFRLQSRYIGTGTVDANIASDDLSLIYQRAGVDYVAQPLAGFPALEVAMERDTDAAATFWVPISKQAAVPILAWDPFHAPADVLQWPLDLVPPSAPAPTATSAPPTEAPDSWLQKSGTANDFPIGQDFAGLRPSSDYLVVSWSKSGSPDCRLSVAMESELGASDSFIASIGTSGADVLNLGQVGPAKDASWTLNVLADCDWQVALSRAEDWFGPNGEDVARLIWGAGNLGPAWALVIPGLSPDAEEAKRIIDDLIATDAAASRVNLALRDWFVGNGYVESDPRRASAVKYAILATALQDLIPDRVYEALYAPFAEVIRE